MTTFINDLVLDASVDYLIANGKQLHLLTTYPADYNAVLADSLGSNVPTITKKDNPDAGLGRRAEVAASSIVIDTATNHAGVDQSVTQYAIVDTVGLTVLAVGDVTPKSYANGDTANIPVLSVNLLDAVAG